MRATSHSVLLGLGLFALGFKWPGGVDLDGGVPSTLLHAADVYGKLWDRTIIIGLELQGSSSKLLL